MGWGGVDGGIGSGHDRRESEIKNTPENMTKHQRGDTLEGPAGWSPVKTKPVVGPKASCDINTQSAFEHSGNVDTKRPRLGTASDPKQSRLVCSWVACFSHAGCVA